MTVWRSDVVVLRLPAIRTRFTPREWESVRRVRLVMGAVSTLLEIIVVDEPSCHGGRRRWLRCSNPSCQRLTSVVGLCCTTGTLGCRSCLRWRARVTPSIAPHVAWATSNLVVQDGGVQQR